MVPKATKKIVRIIAISIGALVLTTIGITASDSLQGVSSSLVGQLAGPTATNACPEGMLATPMLETIRCVDVYEAATSPACPRAQVTTSIDTETNISNPDCTAVSESNRQPWTFVTREQAQLLCVRAGKRLPQANEWYETAIGTESADCTISAARASYTGSNANCLSALGTYDMVGNVWEWVRDDVIDGRYNDRSLPDEGYVSQVANDGVAVYTENSPQEGFEADFLWMRETGAFGMLRGGFYGSGSDAGVYAVHAKTLPTVSTQAIGFRCVL